MLLARLGHDVVLPDPAHLPDDTLHAPDRPHRSGRVSALRPAGSSAGERRAGTALAGGRARARCAGRRGEDRGCCRGRGHYPLPDVADHPFASPEDADPLPRPPLPGRHLRRARQWPLRSPAARIPTRPSRDTSPSSADWPAYLIISARRFCPAGGAGRAATFADWPTFEGSNPK
jgi:hypothetical protein